MIFHLTFWTPVSLCTQPRTKRFSSVGFWFLIPSDIHFNTCIFLITNSLPYGCVGVWDKILEPVASVRKESEMLQLFPGYLKGEDLFGLTVSAVARIAESVSLHSPVPAASPQIVG